MPASAGVLRVVPMSWLDRAYEVVARRRYQLFGRFERCPLPAPAHRRRFIDR
jgi:predicted DCC family thiol-disulfide oxidoreductase YuxK